MKTLNALQSRNHYHTGCSNNNLHKKSKVLYQNTKKAFLKLHIQILRLLFQQRESSMHVLCSFFKNPCFFFVCHLTSHYDSKHDEWPQMVFSLDSNRTDINRPYNCIWKNSNAFKNATTTAEIANLKLLQPFKTLQKKVYKYFRPARSLVYPFYNLLIS